MVDELELQRLREQLRQARTELEEAQITAARECNEAQAVSIRERQRAEGAEAHRNFLMESEKRLQEQVAELRGCWEKELEARKNEARVARMRHDELQERLREEAARERAAHRERFAELSRQLEAEVKLRSELAAERDPQAVAGPGIMAAKDLQGELTAAQNRMSDLEQKLRVAERRLESCADLSDTNASLRAELVAATTSAAELVRLKAEVWAAREAQALPSAPALSWPIAHPSSSICPRSVSSHTTGGALQERRTGRAEGLLRCGPPPPRARGDGKPAR